MLPERKFLYETCNARLIKLFDNGAIEEVKFLYTHYGKLQTSAMKALGVSEIISYINGDITRQDAIELASIRTRQYAKRQITWFNNQGNWIFFHPDEEADMINYIIESTQSSRNIEM